MSFVLESQPLSPSGTSECMLGITCENSSRVDQLVDRIIEEGGSVLTQASQQPWGYTALCADPDGHVLQLLAL